jgi:NAD(P)-dependent dehydrogenase (short-subunit alcohol dehydrogenase family)
MRTVQQLFDLTGRVAVITGAGSGIGAVFADALAEAGADVICVDLRMDGIERTARRVQETGRRALTVEADVTDEAALTTAIQRAIEAFGRLDVMVNNAGIGVATPPEETSLADWQRVIDVNLTGVFLGAREAARAMISLGTGGRIINTASILGAVASQPVAASAYAASKGAVVNLTRDLAVHWAPQGILVNAIGPAYFPTEMTHDAFAEPEFLRAIAQRTPLGRSGNLEELKGVIVFLASDASSYVTGQTIYIDGGWTAW